MIETNQDSLREYWDNIKYTNIWIRGGTEKKNGGLEKMFEENIVKKNFPNMVKETVTKVQEAKTIPYRINPWRNTSRHTLIKLTKFKYIEKY